MMASRYCRPTLDSTRLTLMTATPLITALRLLLAILALTAIGNQLRIQLQLQASLTNFFSYFTNLANLLTAVTLLLVACRSLMRRSTTPSIELLRCIAVTNIAIVGIVFSLLLRNVDLGALQPWVNIVLHYVMPVAVVIDWLLQPPPMRLQFQQLLVSMLLPLVYVMYVLIRGALVGWYPYPFLNPATAGGYGGVALYALAITIAFIAVARLMHGLGNRAKSAD